MQVPELDLSKKPNPTITKRTGGGFVVPMQRPRSPKDARRSKASVAAALNNKGGVIDKPSSQSRPLHRPKSGSATMVSSHTTRRTSLETYVQSSSQLSHRSASGRNGLSSERSMSSVQSSRSAAATAASNDNLTPRTRLHMGRPVYTKAQMMLMQMKDSRGRLLEESHAKSSLRSERSAMY